MPATPSKAKKPSDHQKTKKNTGYGSGWKSPFHDLDLPSGERCQVKRPGVQGLIKAGVLQSMDALTAIVQTEVIPRAEGKPVTAAETIMKDPAKFTEMLETVDKIVLHVVTQPKLLSDKVAVMDEDDIQVIDADGKPLFRDITDEERDPEAVYIDYVDLMDRMYIMNFAVGGSADLVDFREKAQNAVGGVPAGEAAADASK